LLGCLLSELAWVDAGLHQQCGVLFMVDLRRKFISGCWAFLLSSLCIINSSITGCLSRFIVRSFRFVFREAFPAASVAKH
jgi:hypothetical protein